MDRIFFAVAAAFGALGVIAGSYGAHGLEKCVGPEMVNTFKTGVLYHFFHVFALLACSFAVERWSPWAAKLAGLLFILGIILFSGSLYLYVLTGTKRLTILTPIGGVFFVGGWIALGLSPLIAKS